MKISDVIKELQEYISEEGDKELNGIDITQDSAAFSATRINKINILNDGKKAIILFMS